MNSLFTFLIKFEIGPAGSTAAYFMAKQGFRVALLDKKKFPRHKPCGDAWCAPALVISLTHFCFSCSFFLLKLLNDSLLFANEISINYLIIL